MRIIFKLAWFLMRFAFKTLLLLFEGAFWAAYTCWGLVIRASDAGQAVGSVKDGFLRCPQGHAVPLSGGTYECGACGFTWSGSILRCGNPECGASTPFIDCPVCGLSVRNPFRWGRP